MKERRLVIRNHYAFTVLWFINYILLFALVPVDNIPGWLPDILILGLGIPLTVLMAMEWSFLLPGRKNTLLVLLASAAWWTATLMLVRSDYEFRYFHALNTLILLIGTLTIGYWLAGELEKAGHLIPVVILGSMIDLWSVFQGPSKSVGHQVIAHVTQQLDTLIWSPPPVVEFLLLSWPMPGTSFMMPVMGFGDLVFIGLFLAASRRFALSMVTNVILLVIGIANALVVATITQVAIPALPFLCGFFMLGNFRKLKLSKSEWRITLFIAGVIVLGGILNYLLSGMLAG